LTIVQKGGPTPDSITAVGNLVKYGFSPLDQTADLDTAKLHWNSVISTLGAKYMCLDFKIFFLMAQLDYFEYMCMLLVLFLIYIQE
jgi:hypothetical protein